MRVFPLRKAPKSCYGHTIFSQPPSKRMIWANSRTHQHLSHLTCEPVLFLLFPPLRLEKLLHRASKPAFWSRSNLIDLCDGPDDRPRGGTVLPLLPLVLLLLIPFLRIGNCEKWFQDLRTKAFVR